MMGQVMADKLIGLVPLRGGSKGLPGKNIKELAGKPLFKHATDQALRVLGDVVISTDIKSIVENPPAGAKVLARPTGLARDTTPMDAVIKDAILRRNLQGHTIVLLQATSPLRLDEDIKQALTLHKTGRFELVMSVTPTDPGFLKYGVVQDGQFRSVSHPAYCFANRQSLPAMSRPNGAVYVFSADTFLANGRLATTKIGAIEMPEDRSRDIDTADDFAAVEQMLRHS